MRGTNRKKAFLLAMMLVLMPIALICMITLSGQLMQESGMTLISQRKAKAFYLANAGLNAAFHVFGLNNFQGHTHESDGITRTSTGDPNFLGLYGYPGHALDASGCYLWSWDPSQPAQNSYTRCGDSESYRFKVYLPTPTTWLIHCEATVGSQLAIQEMSGSVTDPYGYTVFDNGDLNDFTKAETETVTGKIYARGDLFIRPWKTDGLVVPGVNINIVKPTLGILNFNVDSIVSAGRIIRYQDAMGEPDPGGTVTIASTSLGLAPTPMEGLSNGPAYAGQFHAYDSYNANWRPAPLNTDDAITRYKDALLDSQLGVQQRELPPAANLGAGGYYDLKASVHIDASTTGSTLPYVSDRTFYNQAEDRYVTVKEVDVSQLIAPGNFPSNGVIYSSVPLRLVNGYKLNQNLTVASPATIYTKGDFNKDNPDGSGAGQSVSASLITTDRVYSLTEDFNDASSATYYDPAAPANVISPHFATDPPHYPGDPTDVLEINAAIMDGQATRGVRAWVDSSSEPNFPATANPYKVSGYFMNPFTGGSTGTKQIPDTQDPHPGLKVAYPNSDEFLENMQHIDVHYGGTRIHLRGAKMAKNWDNSDCLGDPTITPWVVKSSYIPANSRTYVPSSNPSRPVMAPPLGLLSCRKQLWRVVQ